MTLHAFLDSGFSDGGLDRLSRLLADGANPNARAGPRDETALHVAARRRRPRAVARLLDAGADPEARTRGGKTAYAHAERRGFTDVTQVLLERGAAARLTPADRFAVAVTRGKLGDASAILRADPAVIRTGNDEEDRLLADVAGRPSAAPVAFLVEHGADLEAPGLDEGTPLHQAAWFGQLANARLLVGAGAPVDRVDPTHGGTPLAWAVHGSRFSGDAEARQVAYAGIARLLLSLRVATALPPSDAPGRERLRREASDAVRAVLDEYYGRGA